MFDERGQNFIDSEDLVRILQPLTLDDSPPRQRPRKNTYMQPKHLAHLIFKHKLLHLIIEQPLTTLQHEFIILRSGNLTLSLSLGRRRLHQFEIHGGGIGVRVEGRVIHAFDRDIFEKMQTRVQSLTNRSKSSAFGVFWGVKDR
jgi:hypothetical protein